MDADGDFENAIVFRGNPITNVLWAIFFFFWTVLFAYATIFFTDASKYMQAVHVIGLLLFLLADAYIIRNICRGRRVMVAIGERGIFDWRISDEWIPLTAITRIDKGINPSLTNLFINFVDALWVRVEPAFAATFREKLPSCLMRIGIVGYRVVTIGVEGSKDQFFAPLDRYNPHWREKSMEAFFR